MILILALLLFSSSTQALEISPLPVKQIEADSVSFNEKIVHLQGNVTIVHEFGTLHCDQSKLLRSDQEKEPQKIFLYDNVHIQFTDGSSLSADNGEINCTTLEASFTSNTPKKVIYITQPSPSQPPMKATSRALHALISKEESGYALKSLKGEGAVHIEYLQKEPS